MLKANSKSLAADLRARPVTQQWAGSTTRPSCSHNKPEDRSQLEEGPKCCVEGMACRLAGVLVQHSWNKQADSNGQIQMD